MSLWFVLPWLLATLALVALAVGVVYFLAVSRRSPADWQSHVREHRAAFGQTDMAAPEESIQLETVSLQSMLSARSESGDAYFNPQNIPGFQRIEQTTDRIEKRIAERRSKEG